ncbi:MAG TPA: type II secretion system protein N [Steroidobacteraceae bacterium]
MNRVWPYVALGVVAYLVFATVTLPANVVVPRVQPPSVTLAGLDGTIWNGSAQVLQVAGTHLGSVRWKLHVLPLLTLRPAATVEIRRTDGFARGDVSFSGNRVALEDVSAALPISALPPRAVPGGWQGSINARFAALTLADGWPIAAAGTVELLNLTGPARRPMNLGSLQVTFPAAAGDSDTLTGTINDIEGPIELTGTLQLKASDRSYLVDGWIKTKPDAPADLVRSLNFPGEVDAQGRRQFSFSGNL